MLLKESFRELPRTQGKPFKLLVNKEMYNMYASEEALEDIDQNNDITFECCQKLLF